MTSLLPPPCDIGAPVKYTRWRAYQAEAVLAAADSRKRVVIMGAPTAFGKSLSYVSTALLTSKRTVILTSTNALSDQLMGDYSETGMVEIRGLGTYECIEGQPTGIFGDMRREGYRADRGMPMMCDEAPCQAGAFCARREGGCHYYDAYRKATLVTTRLIVTNYAYWMSINKYGEGLGPVDLLVIDEAHKAIDELGGFVGTELRQGEMESALPGEAGLLAPGSDQKDWSHWAGYWRARANNALDLIRASIKESERTGGNRTGEKVGYNTLRRARELRRIIRKLDSIAGMRGEWVIDWTEDSQRRPMVRFDPVWPGEYAESCLFVGVPKVVMVSATVRPETADKLGVNRADMDFREYPSTIPKANRPIIYTPIAHMNQKVAAAGMKAMSSGVDQVIGRRLDRKGLVQTVSYPRARAIYIGSEYRDRMLIHDSTNTKEVIARFKASRKPLVLVSPVVDTGYDFPYEQAEYQILVKVPFPVTVDKVVKARTERDKGYRDYVTMIKIVQMAGRICRAEDDKGETFILDSDFGWWYWGKSETSGIRLVPAWFSEAVIKQQVLGQPLPKLVRVA